MSQSQNAPTNKGDAKAPPKSADATTDRQPVPATQDPNAEKPQKAPVNEFGPVDTKSRPELPGPGELDPAHQRALEEEQKTFEEKCEEVGKGVKKLIDAGLNGNQASELAYRIYRDTCDHGGRYPRNV